LQQSKSACHDRPLVSGDERPAIGWNPMRSGRRQSIEVCLFAAVLGSSAILEAKPIPVRYREGALHGFLVLRNLKGETLAAGDLIQNVRGDAMRLLDAVHFRCLNARGTLFTVQKALPLFNVFVDFTNRLVGYRSRRVRAWGSRPSRRPAPALACRYTPGRSSICHFERKCRRPNGP